MKAIALLTLLAFSAYAEDVPVPKGGTAPYTGILVTPEDYGQIIKEKAEMDKLKIDIETLKQLDAFKEQKNKELLDLTKLESEAWKTQADKNAQRSFLEQHGFQLGVAAGMIITVLLTFAVVQGFKIQL